MEENTQNQLDAQQIASMIDHTLLKPDATREQIVTLCQEAAEYHFASVCINPGWVPIAAELLKGSTVKVCTVIGFPLGATSTASKVEETRIAIQDGATEVDMVIAVGRLKGGDNQYIENDIAAVTQQAHSAGALVKVIIETCLLTDTEKMTACLIAKKAVADFVKTSTGFASAGATVEDIRLMRTTVGPDLGVKAAGGVRSLEDARNMIEAGATRIGTSSGVKIIQGLKVSGGY